MFVLEGSILTAPIANDDWFSNEGENVVPLFTVFHKEPWPEATKYSLVIFGFTAMSITLPPVTAGPMLLKVNAGIEMFFNESEALGRLLFCALSERDTSRR